jgi:hypothetical protein
MSWTRRTIALLVRTLSVDCPSAWRSQPETPYCLELARRGLGNAAVIICGLGIDRDRDWASLGLYGATRTPRREGRSAVAAVQRLWS